MTRWGAVAVAAFAGRAAGRRGEVTRRGTAGGAAREGGAAWCARTGSAGRRGDVVAVAGAGAAAVGRAGAVGKLGNGALISRAIVGAGRPQVAEPAPDVAMM
ncbi:hypothetical protein GCM10025331_69480 [Actinoplanes utahensis]|nr:hypothetical protein Aut01nite_73760 [Actinoplanes utahensis]